MSDLIENTIRLVKVRVCDPEERQVGTEWSKLEVMAVREIIADRDRLRAENERLKKAMDAHSEAEILGQTHACKVESENQRLRKALEEAKRWFESGFRTVPAPNIEGVISAALDGGKEGR